MTDSEYTPTTEEIIRSYTIPDHVTHPRRDGESLGQYLSRISIEGHASQVESEAAAHRWLSEHDRQVSERAYKSAEDAAAEALELWWLTDTSPDEDTSSVMEVRGAIRELWKEQS